MVEMMWHKLLIGLFLTFSVVIVRGASDPAGSTGTPTVSASATDKNVKVEIIQATSISGTAIVKFDYKGVVKTYKVVFTPLA